MEKDLIIFPNQLFDPNELPPVKRVIVLEDPYFYTRLNFHKQKLVLHYASIRKYVNELKDFGLEVRHIDLNSAKDWSPETDFLAFDPIEKDLQKKVASWQKIAGGEILQSPNFLLETAWLSEYFKSHKFFMANFYQEVRKKLGILLDKNGKPEGGKWSFDQENRKPYKKDLQIPRHYIPTADDIVTEAKSWVEENFPNNPGSLDCFYWPTARNQAEYSFEKFLEERFEYFGDFEDAISKKEHFLFHSHISSSLNIGLVSPKFLVNKILSAYNDKGISIASTEGLIRQIIGWREFVRAIYLLKGGEMKEANFWKFNRKLPKSFYTGTTGLDPVDDAILSALKTSYGHHIERLMVLGNIMLLLEIKPQYVLDWFSEIYIDAYEWVMVPNVIGMSQYADGGSMVTKPYISSSNYIRKMSDYKKGEWSDVWDALYWTFIYKHLDNLKDNPRLKFQISRLASISKGEMENYQSIYEEFIKS